MPDPLGRSCIVPFLKQRGVTVVDVAIVRPGSLSANPKWLMFFLNAPSIRQEIEFQSTGTTRRRIARGKLAEMQLPIPPLNEQKRIADKLDSILARVEACRERLDRIPAILKRFRQAVLAAATSGKLTEEWRVQHEVSICPDEVISKRYSYAIKDSEQKALKSFFAQYAPCFDDMQKLPTTWVTTNIGAIGIVSNGSTPSRQVNSYWGGDIAWVSSGEVKNAIISSTREQITAHGYENASVRMLPKGTVLIAMIGEGKTRGQSALLNLEACINQNIAAVVPVKDLIDSKYLWYWFQRQYERNRVVGSGTGPQALNCQRVRELPVNLPPLQEQTEIVRRVEELFAYADRIEARYHTARARIDKLTPAILAKAFRGELVPQNPDDEPASVLLERIRASRAANAVTSKSRRVRNGAAK